MSDIMALEIDHIHVRLFVLVLLALIAEQPLQDSGPWTVPEDCYFMMGDNRNHSNDSRAWENPFVHKDKILGKVLFCSWKGFAWLA